MLSQGCPFANPPRSVPGKARGLALAGAVALGALAPLLAGAPAEAQTDTGAAERAVSAEVDLAEVDVYRLALLKMRGHLGMARALIQVGAEGAEHHMGLAIARIYQGTEAALAERSAPVTAAMLSELENAAGLEKDRALPAIESAEQAINGSFAQTGALERGSVLGLVEALLRAAVASYAGAVSDHEVADVRKYQSGRGYVTQAEALVRHSSALADQPGQKDLLKVVTLIRQAWPGIMPPPIAFDPDSVVQRLDEAVAVMQGMR